MKLFTFRKNGLLWSLFILFTFLISGIDVACAQVNVDPAEYRGTGTDVTSLDWNDSSEATERVLLYNVGKDMFLTAGGFWGTRTATFTIGLPLMLIRVNKGTDEAPAYVYQIRGPFKNSGGSNQGNYLGVVDIANSGAGVYFDRSNEFSEEKDSEGNIIKDDAGNIVYKEYESGVNWTFEKDDNASKDGNVVYRLKMETTYNSSNDSYSKNNNYSLYANETMEINVFDGGNNNLVRALTSTEAASKEDQYGQWKIVTVSQMNNEFNKTYDKSHPSDATFLLRAQNFNRMNMYSGFDSSETLGWHKSTGSNFTYSTGFGDISGYTDSDDKTYGMFYCGSIKNGCSGEKLYQEVTITESGWYRIDCQGLFYNKDVPDKAIARLYAKVTDSGSGSLNTIDNAYVDLLPKFYGEPHKNITFNEKIDGKTSYVNNNDIVDNKIEASALFYNQKYPNHLLVYVNLGQDKKPKTLELGIEITENMSDVDYVYFDDFQLRYLGESFALDEGVTDFHNGMGDDEVAYKNRVLIFKRTFSSEQWNSICLPVDLTKEQLNTAFFPNPLLAKLRDSSQPGMIEFVTVDFSGLENDDIALHAGQCYLIRPGYHGRTDTGEIEVGDINKTKIKAPYYTIDRVSLTKKDVEDRLGISDVSKFIDNKDAAGAERLQDYYTISGTDYAQCKLRVYGTFQKLTGASRVPATSYTFVGGKLYHLPSAYSQKGFSCWIEDGHQVENPVEAKHALGCFTYINGIHDSTTSIDGMFADMRDDVPDAVYSIQGQAVRRGTVSFDGLPCGVYIVSGKRVIVK